MKIIIRCLWMTIAASLLTSACQPPTISPTLPQPNPTSVPQGTITFSSTETPQPTSTPMPLVPDFTHIGIIIFEKRDFDKVIDNRDMPYFNLLAKTFTLLTQHHAVTHPSLPNYLALIGGDTFDITDDCQDSECPIDAPSLPDLIEQSGRTWKTYQDDMPAPCFEGDTWRYLRKHNPFIFFDPIRLNGSRCNTSVVPMTRLDEDIADETLPNFFFISPDICYSGQDCSLDLVDGWLKELVEKIHPALNASGGSFLLIITWDEGQGNDSCCGLPEKAGGRVATILVSQQVKSAFQDPTPYTHYSILKSISEAWGLPYLGHAADAETTLITAPWK